MWRAALAKEGINSLYFNAWETDFVRVPLVALIGELSQGMRDLNIPAGNPAAKHWAKAKKVGEALAKSALPTAIKVATVGILNADDAIEAALAEFGEKYATDHLKQYEEARKSMYGFRKELADFAAALSVHSGGKPLVIVVDELDRCRPDYAVSVLETIKHLFTVSKVAFLVATDSKQIANSVRHTYGADLDADAYLRRFFDLALSLPAPETKKFVIAQFENFGLDEIFSKRLHSEFRYEREQIVGVFGALCEATGCSLRDQEKCFSLLSLALRATPNDHYLHPIALCAAIVIRIKNVALYRDFLYGAAGPLDIVSYLTSTAYGAKYFRSSRGYAREIEAVFAGVKIKRIAGAEKAEILGKYEAMQAIPDTVDSRRANEVMELVKDYNFSRVIGSFNSLVKKIDLVAAALPEIEQ